MCRGTSQNRFDCLLDSFTLCRGLVRSLVYWVLVGNHSTVSEMWWVLRCAFRAVSTVLWPVTAVWNAVFAVPVCTQHNKIIILGTGGGCGKTTLAAQLRAADPRYAVVHIDEHKFGEHWVRRSDEEFVGRVGTLLQGQKRYVIESFYDDEKQPRQRELIDKYLPEADLVVWLDMPYWVSVWRILLRSLKRKIGIEHGAYPETLSSVAAMLSAGFRTRAQRYSLLQDVWDRNERRYAGRFVRVKWPFYCFV